MRRLFKRYQNFSCVSRVATSSRDALVIGAGPAGLATALALTQKGFCVTVADGADLPIEKVCGEGILPEGVAALRHLGVELPADAGFRLRGLRFVGDRQSADAAFPHASGLGIRRVQLHRILVDAARRAGVKLCWRTPVKGISFDRSVLFQSASIRPQWIIGADGGTSRVRRWAGLQSRPMRHRRFAFRRHYEMAPWTDFVEVHWGKSCQFYVTPLAENEIGVVLLSSDAHLRMDEALLQFPLLSAHLSRARIATPERGGVTGDWHHSRVVRGNIALVGDAAGMVDAISGEGLRLGFHQSLALAGAIASGNPSDYQREHRRLMRRPRAMVRLMLALQSKPAFRRRVLRILDREPELFQRLLAIHTGVSSPAHLASTGARFGWRFLVEEF